MKKKALPNIIKVLSTLAILYLLFTSIDFNYNDFKSVWQQLQPGWLIAALPVVIVVLGIKSFRWRAIVQSEGFGFHWKKSLSAYLAAFSLGVVTPGRLGELLKVYNLRQEVHELNAISAFRTVVLDRLFDMFFLALFGLAGILFFLKPFGEMGPTAALALSLAVSVALLFTGKFMLNFFEKRIFPENNLLKFLNGCISGMTTRYSVGSWVISGIAYGVYFLGIQFLFWALEIKISFVETGFIISLIGLILLLPISVAGFGTREAGLVYLLSFYGISPEIAIGFSLLQFVAFFVWGGLFGLFFWMATPISLKLIREDSQKVFMKIKNKSS